MNGKIINDIEDNVWEIVNPHADNAHDVLRFYVHGTSCKLLEWRCAIGLRLGLSRSMDF